MVREGKGVRFEAGVGGDPEEQAQYLRMSAQMGPVAQVKRRMIDLLDIQPGQRCLDVGCGLGDDVRLMGQCVLPGGIAIGVDANADLLERARAAASPGDGCEFLDGDAVALPIDDASIDRLRAERILIWVSDVERAVSEMRRVLRPGGRLALMEPDFGVVTWDSTDDLMDNAVRIEFCSRCPSPRIGRVLFRLLVDAGFVDVEAGPAVADLQPAADFAVLRQVTFIDECVDSLVGRGEVERERADAWLSELEARSQRGALWGAAPHRLFVARAPGA